jgi:hypothetical protein
VTDRTLLITAALLLLLTRCGLALLGYGRLRWLLSRVSRPHLITPAKRPEDLEKIIWAVTASATRVLGNRPCLAIAIGTHWLLNRRGIPTEMRIGVTRGAAGGLDAHAWIEQNGRVLIGRSPSLSHYYRLPPLNFWG